MKYFTITCSSADTKYLCSEIDFSTVEIYDVLYRLWPPFNGGLSFKVTPGDKQKYDSMEGICERMLIDQKGKVFYVLAEKKEGGE